MQRAFCAVNLNSLVSLEFAMARNIPYERALLLDALTSRRSQLNGETREWTGLNGDVSLRNFRRFLP